MPVSCVLESVRKCLQCLENLSSTCCSMAQSSGSEFGDAAYACAPGKASRRFTRGKERLRQSSASARPPLLVHIGILILQSLQTVHMLTARLETILKQTEVLTCPGSLCIANPILGSHHFSFFTTRLAPS